MFSKKLPHDIQKRALQKLRMLLVACVIDEIQYAPNLLSYIKIAVDNSDEKG